MTDCKITFVQGPPEVVIQVLPDNVPEPLEEYTLILSEHEALTLLTAVFTIQALLCGAKTDIADWAASEFLQQDLKAFAGITAQLALQNPKCLSYVLNVVK